VLKFWTGKNETLVQAIVEGLIKAVLSGVVIALVAQIILSSVERKMELASKRNALISFKNKQLTVHLSRLSEAYLAVSCARHEKSVIKDTCRSGISNLLTEIDVVKSDLKTLYPDVEFGNLEEFRRLSNDLFQGEHTEHIDSNVTDAEACKNGKTFGFKCAIDAFVQGFGEALDDVAANFQ